MSAPLRVLHLATGNLYGGVEVFLRTLARRGETAGMATEFTTCWEGRLATELRSAGARVHPLGEVRLSRPWQIWRARRRLASVLAAEHFEVVVVHSAWTHAIFGSLVTAAALPLIMGVHTLLPRDSRLERFARRVPLDGVFSNSFFSAASARNWYPKHPDPEVITLPVEPIPALNPLEREECRRGLGAESGDCVFIQASRMQELKGVHTLVAALATMTAVPGWRAWIAGGAQRPLERDYENRLKTQIRHGGLEGRVHLLGERKDIPKLLASADVHIQLNQEPEAFGITFVEAAYAGIPSISSREGGSAEFVDDSCGVRLEPGDPETLARELQRMLREPAWRKALGAGGPRRARNLCDPERQLNQLATFLRARSRRG